MCLEPHEDTKLSTCVTAGMHRPAVKIEFKLKVFAQTEFQTRVERKSIVHKNRKLQCPNSIQNFSKFPLNKYQQELKARGAA